MEIGVKLAAQFRSAAHKPRLGAASLSGNMRPTRLYALPTSDFE